MVRRPTVPRRIDLELDEVLHDLAKKNGLSIREASRELARISKQNKEKDIIRRLKF